MTVRSSGSARRTRKAPMASIRYEDTQVREVPVRQLRVADFAESKPWRDVRSVHGMAHYSGKYASATTGGHVVYESRLELARLLLADFDPAVQGIFAQPCRLAARVGDRVRHHVPDFLLAMRSGTVRVVNVKPADRLQDPKIAEALAWPGELFRQHGWEYEIWSGADRVLLENVRFLAGYRRPGVVPEAEVEQAWRQVVDGEELALVERRLAGDRPSEEARPALMALLWSGRLMTDLSRPLSGASVLRRCA
ncbi:TnsA-like heteromeric transposase endonuclease subunit [Streptomyces sp. NBC_01435]|uniref:TnsA-like heteromeric transposase endonuclease subunit n=1 Tax=Streptomyces sp. NBC_01435 TaxID=2903865 RepID=UPI002E2F10BB|nr:TnsA-like heteromeric transposase endonuclease subunit [Streptomyces sp. NBC_01435]